ncbi:MAG: hypothetical protein GKS05_00425 [Nitrospirales bacterium]|nr:hypothetical protein [Nitrospirales bacterium]
MRYFARLRFWILWGQFQCAFIMMSGLGLLGGPSLSFGLPTLSPSDPQPIHEARIDIRGRVFYPTTLNLQVGHKTRLIIQNKDAELHAFVPVGLFAGTLNIGGNGAPQFGPEGLRRVLIPSSGQTEILFVPKEHGVYPFFCDLPGHVMNGSIVVEKENNMIQ